MSSCRGRPGSPLSLKPFVATCLSKDPARRYSSTHELVADLEQVGICGALLAATFSIGLGREAIAMLLATVTIAAALASFIIEPATARAAFGS